MAKLCEFGRVVQTAGVTERRGENHYFDLFVRLSLNRYIHGDWGDTCGEDARTNNQSIKDGERILAVYIYDPEDVCQYIGASVFCVEDLRNNNLQWKKTEEKDPNAVKIWIITEWDRSVTTILFPDEY